MRVGHALNPEGAFDTLVWHNRQSMFLKYLDWRKGPMDVEELREEVAEELMKEKNKNSWLSYLALSTVLLAVCASLSSFKENNNSVDTVLNQTQAANQWAYYQSKSIKGYLYEMQAEKLAIDLQVGEQTYNPKVKADFQAKISTYHSELARYKTEKEQIMKEAKKFEQLRDDAQKRQDAFGIAVIFLQMGILLSSISALLKIKTPWIVGCIVGVVGVVYFFDGIFLLF
jgi:hypothetical protein